MSDIFAEIIDGIVTIKQVSDNQTIASWTKPLNEFEFKETEATEIMVDEKDRYKIFLWEETEEGIFLAYSKSTDIKCIHTTQNSAYLRLLDKMNQVLSASITEDKLTIKWFGGMRNRYNLEITDCRLNVDENNYVPFDMPISKRLIREEDVKKKKFLRTFEFDTDQLIYDNAKINCKVYVTLMVNGYECNFSLNMKDDTIEDSRDYYVPFSSIYYRDYALHLRRSLLGNLMFIRRPMEPVEKTRSFQHLESEKVSAKMYEAGKAYREAGKKKINLFYEKFAEKAEEGSYDVFQEALKNNSSEAYFVIDKHSPDYKKIRRQRHIVKKYSRKYYKLLYRASSFISTESPTHINIIRSNNKYFRKRVNEINFVFLQHGVTYLKCHGRNSPFLVGKEAEPSYMVVGSEKEKKVVSEMLGLPAERILNTGLPIFSKIDFKHINQDSDDIAVVMLTWKPYEEYLTDFEQSTYYQSVVAISELLRTKLPSENVIIVAHPKIQKLLENTPLGDNIWDKPISEVLSIAKLLITDYSSVCYNSFYQGGGVVFYQEDIDLYEEANGKLIPQDDEYIGKRAFSFDELKEMLDNGIRDRKILLDQFRTKEFEARYQTINEFSDGKNIERICQELKKLDII